MCTRSQGHGTGRRHDLVPRSINSPTEKPSPWLKSQAGRFLTVRPGLSISTLQGSDKPSFPARSLSPGQAEKKGTRSGGSPPLITKVNKLQGHNLAPFPLKHLKDQLHIAFLTGTATIPSFLPGNQILQLESSTASPCCSTGSSGKPPPAPLPLQFTLQQIHPNQLQLPLLQKSPRARPRTILWLKTQPGLSKPRIMPHL